MEPPTKVNRRGIAGVADVISDRAVKAVKIEHSNSHYSGCIQLWENDGRIRNWQITLKFKTPTILGIRKISAIFRVVKKRN
jgi:hypothetical protein